MCRRLTKSRPACQKQRPTPVAYTHRLEPLQSVHYNPATATGVCVDFLAVEFLSPPGRLRLATGASPWETDRVISRAPYGAIARLGGLKRSVAPLGSLVEHVFPTGLRPWLLANVPTGLRNAGAMSCDLPENLRTPAAFSLANLPICRELAGVPSVDSLSSIVYSLRCAPGRRPARQPRWGY